MLVYLIEDIVVIKVHPVTDPLVIILYHVLSLADYFYPEVLRLLVRPQILAV